MNRELVYTHLSSSAIVYYPVFTLVIVVGHGGVGFGNWDWGFSGFIYFINIFYTAFVISIDIAIVLVFNLKKRKGNFFPNLISSFGFLLAGCIIRCGFDFKYFVNKSMATVFSITGLAYFLAVLAQTAFLYYRRDFLTKNTKQT